MLGLKLSNPGVGVLQLPMGLLQLRRSTLQVSVECCRDLGESVEAWVLGACQWCPRLLSATGKTRDVAESLRLNSWSCLKRIENRALLVALLTDAW
jgi:hypothetical protein